MQILMAMLAAAVLCAQPVSATVLFAGGEDADFVMVNSPQISTNTAFRRALWSRAALGAFPNSAIWPPAGAYFYTDVGNQSSIWVHAIAGGNTITTTNFIGMMILDGSGQTAFAIRGGGAPTQVKLAKVSIAGAFTDLATCSGLWPQTAVAQIDLSLNYQTSGSATLYVNGASSCSFSGDVTTDSRTSIARVAFGNFQGAGNAMFWSEIIIATTDTRSMNLLTVAPLANGNAVQWSNSTGSTPCTSTILSATTYNDANFVFTGTTGQIEQCTVSAGIPSGSWTVPAYITSARTLVGVGGPQNIRFLPRISGTNYPSSDITPGLTFGRIGTVWATNPATSSAWLTTDFTAAGFNIGLESRP